MDYERLNKLLKIAEDEDIGIFFKKMPKRLKGYSTYVNGYYDIFINSSMTDKEILLSIAHELRHVHGNMIFDFMGDYQKERYERRVQSGSIAYIITYDDIVNVLKDTYIRCEYEAAEELHVDLDTFSQAFNYYKARGYPVRQCEFIDDWRQWDY